KETLNKMLFPIGHLEKDEVRKIALEQGFATALKPESQEICFVTNDDYKSFLKPHVSSEKGIIRHDDGTIVGEHEGYVNYTRGQRRGLGLAAKVPLYVKKVDAEKNEIIVGEKKSLEEAAFSFERCNWIVDPLNKNLEVKTRYRQIPVPVASLERRGAAFHAKLSKPLFAITPGQAAVFYENDRLIGGGWIN
ncbi:MAG TPA: tRNA methyl transferase PRC-barrel domain-containing protein, partial [Bdellovibrionota bacterium]|nr:tRNA methyl transferase PRC-barrel domain-containing protein [Bdellovibrionota bacterium]